MITDCIKKRFEEFKEKSPEHYEFTKNLKCIHCNHEEPFSSIRCVMSIVRGMSNSKDKYVICSQKDQFKLKLRTIPGVPLIYFNRSVLTLDPPSRNTSSVMQNMG